MHFSMCCSFSSCYDNLLFSGNVKFTKLMCLCGGTNKSFWRELHETFELPQDCCGSRRPTIVYRTSLQKVFQMSYTV